MKELLQRFIIHSQYFFEDIECFLLDLDENKKDKPIFYLTDGEKMVNKGSFEQLVELTKANKIKDAYYVFVSTVDPATGEDLRNDYFFCNPNYLSLFEKELIPAVEKKIGQTFQKEQRSLVGISFGGLNAAFFSARSTAFQNFAILSPITHPRKVVNREIMFSKNKNLTIFISTGIHDAEPYFDTLSSLYQAKGYRLKRLETGGKHDFENWNDQLEVISQFFNPF